MPDITLFHLVFALLFGGLLGFGYFALLWLTVKNLARVRWPALWVMPSLLLRIGGVAAGLYWMASFHSWLMLGCSLAGILVVRNYFNRYLAASSPEPETSRAGPKH